ncbi:unnamed protein product [Penicillium glandicola]
MASAEYSALDSEEGPETETKELRWKTRSNKLTCLVSLFIGIAVGIGLSSAFNPTVQLVTNAIAKARLSPPEVNVDGDFVFDTETGEAKCGTHWTEAKRLGCHFDVMASRWYSPSCFNQGVLGEMLEEVNFKWYADREHTKEVSRDVVLAGEFEAVYPDNDYHIMHCLYLWRRLHSAIIEHRHLDDDKYPQLAYTSNMKIFTTLMLLSIGASQAMGLVIPRAMATEPVAEEAVADYGKRAMATEPVAEEAVADYGKRAMATEPVAEEAVADYDKRAMATEPVAEEAVADYGKRAMATEPVAEEAVADYGKRAMATEPVAEEAVADYGKRAMATEPVAEEAVADYGRK